MFKDAPLLAIIVAVISLTVIFILVDGLFLEPEIKTGKVIDKQFTSSSIRAGSGVAVTSGGQTSAIATTEYQPEKFVLMVESGGEIYTATCDPKVYYSTENGDEIKIEVYTGRFTDYLWDVYGIK